MIRVRAAGWGDGWWRVGGDFYAAEGGRVWRLGPGRGWWAVGAVHQVVPGDDGPVAWVDGRSLRLGPDGAARPHRLPFGWVADGFVYARVAGEVRCVEAVAPRERVWVGGGGTVVVEALDHVRAATAGRAPRRVAPAAGGLRLTEDGTALAWVEQDGARRTELGSGRALPREGLPVTPDLWWRDGQLIAGRLRHTPVVREGTAARDGRWLAGPAGRVWDLAEGRPVTAPGTVRAGVTVAHGGGFVTIDGESGHGHRVGADGVADAFRVPVDADDVVVAGVSDGGAVWVRTAEGHGFRVVGGAVSPASPPRIPPRRPPGVTASAGRFRDAWEVEVGGVRWWWNDTGWLWSEPAG